MISDYQHNQLLQALQVNNHDDNEAECLYVTVNSAKKIKLSFKDFSFINI